MSSRFNLRTRRSMKLNGQIECTSCRRHYFPAENSDDENSDDDEQTKKVKQQLCCDCDAKQVYKSPPPKRRIVQRQNGAPSPILTQIKQEKIDSDYSPAKINGYPDGISSNAKQKTTKANGNNRVNCDNMVQIHSSELLSQPMLPLNINSEYIVRLYDMMKLQAFR